VLKVSPAMLAAYYGAEFSLVNRLARCRKVDCEAKCSSWPVDMRASRRCYMIEQGRRCRGAEASGEQL